MADVTALELVNSVLTFHRFEQVNDFSKNEAQAALQVINMAVDKVLNSQDWEFARRHDGVLLTDPKVDITVTFPANFSVSSAGYGTTLSTTTTNGIGYTRFVNLDDGVGEVGVGYGITNTYSQGTPTVYYGTFDAEWCGTATGGIDSCLFYTAEYMLPEYVRGMISASKPQSGALYIETISPEVRLEEIMTEPHSHISDLTRTIYQGGTARPTSLTQTGETDYGLRVIVFPVPETKFRINYSYYYRYPQLVNPTDELDGITTSVSHDVVNWAYAHSNLTGIGNDPKLGLALKGDTRYEIAETRSSDKATKSYRGTICPFGSYPRRYNPRGRWDSQTIVVP